MKNETESIKKRLTAADFRLLAVVAFLVASALSARTSQAGTAVATFVGSDTSTLGNWHGVYGADGYSVANNSQSLPSYATFSAQNQQNWTWAPADSTVDPRALQTGSNTGKIAATWYNQSYFYLDVNLTDGNVHQVAVYFLDWDFEGRSESVQVMDAATNNQLDARTVSGFSNGIYLIWNVSGHVHINVTTNSGPNSVISGIFFATNSGVKVTPGTISLKGGQTAQFSAAVTSSTNQNVTWTISPAVGTISSSGLYTAPATIPAAQTITVTATSVANTANASSSMVSLTPGSAIANFVSFDSKTQGNWTSIYGADGYSMANASQTIPTYDPTFAVQNEANWTWASSTSDPRALRIPSSSAAIAATWYNAGSFNFAVNLADGKTHQVALYAVDWDNLGRSETIEIQDGVTNAVLDTETLTKFGNGVYAIWNVTGNVKITVTDTGYPNSVVSGVFFGGAPASGSNTSASTTSPVTTTSNTGSTTATTTNSSSSTTTSVNTSTPPAQGQLTASLTSLSFGSVNIGTTASKTVSLSNTGNANVTISSDSISGAGLNANGASGVILTPGQSTTLNITFDPASAGGVTGSLTIASNASNASLSISLSGTGVQPAPTTYSVDLSWNTSTSSGVVGYYVFRGTVQGGPYTQLTSTAVMGTSYTDTTAQAGQNYYYAVTSLNSSNVQSGYSNVATVVVP